MEGIAKFVLDKAGEGKENFILPENRCIRVDDVEVFSLYSNDSIAF